MKTLIKAIRYAIKGTHHTLDSVKANDIVIRNLCNLFSVALSGIPLIVISGIGIKFGAGRKTTACTIPLWIALWSYQTRPDLDRPDSEEYQADVDDIAQLLLIDPNELPVDPPNNVVVGQVTLDSTTIVERRTRSLPTDGRKARYLRAVVAEAKVRFGTPVDNAANRITVRRFVTTRMESHGLRVTHIAKVVDLVVEAVMVVSYRELYARRMRGVRVHGGEGV